MESETREVGKIPPLSGNNKIRYSLCKNMYIVLRESKVIHTEKKWNGNKSCHLGDYWNFHIKRYNTKNKIYGAVNWLCLLEEEMPIELN